MTRETIVDDVDEGALGTRIDHGYGESERRVRSKNDIDALRLLVYSSRGEGKCTGRKLGVDCRRRSSCQRYTVKTDGSTFIEAPFSVRRQSCEYYRRGPK